MKSIKAKLSRLIDKITGTNTEFNERVEEYADIVGQNWVTETAVAFFQDNYETTLTEKQLDDLTQKILKNKNSYDLVEISQAENYQEYKKSYELLKNKEREIDESLED